MYCKNQLIDICNLIVNSLVAKDYDNLDKHNTFVRVAKNDLLRALDEYGGALTPIPSTAYESNAFDVIAYSDGSGYDIHLDLWIDGKRSDLTLQVDVKINPATNNVISFQIDDLHVM
jgi:hypothetical protein